VLVVNQFLEHLIHTKIGILEAQAPPTAADILL
jgi:hypothetical protein